MSRLTPSDPGADTPGERWHREEVSDLQQNTQGAARRAGPTAASSASPVRSRTCSASRCGSDSPSTGCRASCSSTSTTRPPRAASGSTSRRRPASSAPTAARSICPPSSAPGSPTGCSGSERTLFYSAISSCAATSPSPCSRASPGVGVGLVLVALGSGGLKANATSLVGILYDEDDPRRDAGFSIFYMGINIGALVGPLLTGLLQKEPGFHCGLRARRGRHGDRPDPVRARPQEPPGAGPARRPTRCRRDQRVSGCVGAVAVRRGRLRCWR